MVRKMMMFGLMVIFFEVPSLVAQRGGWEGCVFSAAKKIYTDQQIGGLLLHDSATLVKEISKAIADAKTPRKRRILFDILTQAWKEMDEIALDLPPKI